MKNLLKYKKLVKKIDGELFSLHDYGFIRNQIGSNGSTWINRKERVVIKTPYLISHRKPRLKNIMPTLRFNLNCQTFFVQPLAKRHKTRLALDKFIKMNNLDEEDETYDLHTGNIGWYKGEPVLFDW